jgi:nucleoid DNA-binding protein
MPEKKVVKRLSKSQLIAAMVDEAEATGLTKKQATAALEALNVIVTHQLGKKGAGEFVLPGLIKMNVVVKPAVPEHEGLNPFTKQPTVFKAKPKRTVVKVRVLKGLKDAVA